MVILFYHAVVLLTNRYPGIMQMSLTLPQVITPAFSNSLFAYSIEHKILGGQLVWVVLFAIGRYLFLLFPATYFRSLI